MNVEKKVIEIIAELAVLEVEDVSLDSSLDSLGIDSLGLVESIFAIEETLTFKYPSTRMIRKIVILTSHPWQQSLLEFKNWWQKSCEKGCDYRRGHNQRAWAYCQRNFRGDA